MGNNSISIADRLKRCIIAKRLRAKGVHWAEISEQTHRSIRNCYLDMKWYAETMKCLEDAETKVRRVSDQFEEVIRAGWQDHQTSQQTATLQASAQLLGVITEAIKSKARVLGLETNDSSPHHTTILVMGHRRIADTPPAAASDDALPSTARAAAILAPPSSLDDTTNKNREIFDA